MKIELKTITLQNFKRARNVTINFTHNVVISGGNETGKSTIYDAYLWCLFGVTNRPDTTVQTLDSSNNIIHKLETSVSLVINYNEERDIKIERRLSERYKAENTVEEKFLGTTQTRLIDDVPYSVSAFRDKLNSLCNFDDWFLLSNINIFWSCKVDERRRILMSLAGEINESELMQNYPAVHRGVIVEKKELSEMLKQQNATRKKANDELQTIPAKVQAQDALKVVDDFDVVEEDKKKIDLQLADIDAALQGVVTNTAEQQEYENKLATENNKYNKVREQWQTNHFQMVDEAFKNVTAALESLHEATRLQKEHSDTYVKNKTKISELTNEFNKLMQQWKDVNEKEFNFAKTDVCPVCGRPYTDEMKEQEYENAVNEFNTHKSTKLTEIQNKATEIHNQITVLKGLVNTYLQVTSVSDNNNIKTKQETYNNLVKKRSELQSLTWEQSNEKANADASLQAIVATKPLLVVDTTHEENKLKKKELTKKRDDLIKRLSGRDNNKRIEEEKVKLDKRSRELAQIVADCNEVIRQIKEYKKNKIAVVESKVNSFFSLIRWKFYEQNITNDDEKEICKAIDRNGVDYNSTNDGTVINMGIDIINGISKAKDIYVPLFVDRKESVENVLPSIQQAIYLQCIYGASFKVETF
nr:MAG TPA: chromosome partition protein [Caudoviricetes sp.]